MLQASGQHGEQGVWVLNLQVLFILVLLLTEDLIVIGHEDVCLGEVEGQALAIAFVVRRARELRLVQVVQEALEGLSVVEVHLLVLLLLYLAVEVGRRGQGVVEVQLREGCRTAELAAAVQRFDRGDERGLDGQVLHPIALTESL